MMHISLYERARIWVLAGWRNRAVTFKAVVYALVGVVNTAIDYSVFLAAHAVLGLPLVAANTLSWMVAVSNSYMLNSTITFAAESGRKLRWLAYFTFVASGIAGWLANTAVLVVAVEVLLLPVWLAKLFAVIASFIVNFSLSHFVVFRVRRSFASDHLTRSRLLPAALVRRGIGSLLCRARGSVTLSSRLSFFLLGRV
jgi:putative flippase GtrA